LLAVGATALLVYLGPSPTSGSASIALSNRPMVFVGDRSYSISLWHWPLIVLIDGLA
jgi:peptidoglycan/LPS O-acetylase OafA/YrhL